jgi:hypothetical protein
MNPPKIGQHWPEQKGIYVGIARGFDSEPDGHIVLLDDIPSEDEMNWKDGMAWATGLGNGARLPNRSEMALIGANINDKIVPEGFYWSESKYSETEAWLQYWHSSGSGLQHFNGTKTNVFYVRAIRRVAI